MRKAIWLLVLAPLLLGVNFYPPMVGGQFRFEVFPVVDYDASGVAMEPIPHSIGIVPEGGGSHVACIATPDPARYCEPPGGVTCYGDPYEILATVGTTGVRQPFKAVAYLSADCTSDDTMPESAPSVNTGFTYPGMSPRPPDLQ